MANVTLSITVTDVQASRAQVALGHEALDGTWVNATAQEVKDIIKGWIRGRVIDYETTQAAATDRATRSAESW